MAKGEICFKIGVTFSGEYRNDFVKPACEKLLELGYDRDDIFYDEWHDYLINGVHADDRLIDIYKNHCECVAVFLSPDYIDKPWPGHVEWRAIRELINTTDADNLCLLSVGNWRPSDIPGLSFSQDICKPIDAMSPNEIAAFIDSVYRRITERSANQSSSQSASQPSLVSTPERMSIHIGSKKGRIAVLDDTRHQLNALVRRFTENGIQPVEAHIEIEDLDGFVRDMAQVLTSEWVLPEGADQMQVAEQLLASKRTAHEETINHAISHMLSDEKLCDFDQSLVLFKRHLKRLNDLGIKLDKQELFYLNEYGKECYYHWSFLWIEVIEHLACWLVSNETQRRLKGGYIPIDVAYKDKSGSSVWYFMTFISADRSEKKYRDLYDLLGFHMPVADVFDIPQVEAVDNVLPDFYFEIGSMQARSHPWSYDDVLEKYGRKAFDLGNMVIGPH